MVSRRIRWVYKGLLAVACLAGAQAVGGELPQCPSRPISFALYEHGHLYDMNSGRGIDREVVESLARLSGCRFEFLPRSRARIWHDLQLGTLMMTGSAIPTPERRDLVRFVPYLSVKNFVLVRQSLAVKSAEEFAATPQLRWGAVRSYRHGEAADRFLTGLRAQGRLAEDNDLRTAFRSFANGRTDALFAQAPVYVKYLAEYPPGETVRIEDWFPNDPPVIGALAFSKHYFSAEQVERWRDLVEKMRTDGTLKAIFVRYLGSEQAEQMLRFKME